MKVGEKGNDFSQDVQQRDLSHMYSELCVGVSDGLSVRVVTRGERVNTKDAQGEIAPCCCKVRHGQ